MTVTNGLRGRASVRLVAEESRALRCVGRRLLAAQVSDNDKGGGALAQTRRVGGCPWYAEACLQIRGLVSAESAATSDESSKDESGRGWECDTAKISSLGISMKRTLTEEMLLWLVENPRLWTTRDREDSASPLSLSSRVRRARVHTVAVECSCDRSEVRSTPGNLPTVRSAASAEPTRCSSGDLRLAQYALRRPPG